VILVGEHAGVLTLIFTFILNFFMVEPATMLSSATWQGCFYVILVAVKGPFQIVLPLAD